ncbi:site-specific DNA-methyltransferase [Brevibacillus laterosporus]|uniref:site-specific DNA-methyltransferase n=1 Tax=Brevibacillus laterosporus TaxID=1465 RepID=UPI002406CA63|nr:site-specific DNA-methyltransferase [Brevibacillus laterosporus]MDF9412412.1 site-specific DNA-methyltransferase [Brevibacillus laterosporus]
MDKLKLELTWLGKERQRKIEPRLLLKDEKKSNLEQDNETENMLIHGDNLLALKALEKNYTGEIQCIYIDPPYNTGSAFEHYDDNFEHSIWLDLMSYRLKSLRKLLKETGSIWIQIDDDEQAYLKVLCDQIFGRNNFVNMISVNMKNTSGASGGGEDKRLKKNCEYILIYAKDYSKLRTFKPTYVYEDISNVVEDYRKQNKSWKYTSVLVNEGEKQFLAETVDGSGKPIKIYNRVGAEVKSIKQLMKEEDLTEAQAYLKYSTQLFQTTNAQSSIRTRVWEEAEKHEEKTDIISIEYIPQSGKNFGQLYEQFYKGGKFRLFVWLRDTSEEINGTLYKKDKLGTYWDVTGDMKNLTKEGKVQFPNGKKPEKLIQQVLEMATNEGDLVLDSFLGSGTTAAVAHKMGRKWIGIEMGEQAYTHCKVRLDLVIAGDDTNGITKSVDWQGGGGYNFYELAPSLINIDSFGEEIINKEYSPEMLAAAVAIHEGYTYSPSDEVFWKQSKANEKSYLYVTTRYINEPYINSIHETMEEGEYLVIASKSFDESVTKLFSNITVKKIPQSLLNDCEYAVKDYNLNIISPPTYEYDDEDGEENE